MSDIADFILARIAEDEANPACAGSGEYASCDEWTDRRIAECAAKRRIVELHARDSSGSMQWCATCVDWSDEASDSGWPCPTLRALASVYADHDDYREEWK